MLPPRPWPPFRSSLPAKLAIAATIFIAAVAGAHVSSLDRLVHVGAVTSEVRNRWLDSIRFIGHIGQQVSDLRNAEVELATLQAPGEREKRAAELPDLLDRVKGAIDQYRAVPHDVDEMRAFNAFLERWAEHADDAQRLAALTRSGQPDAAGSLFGSASASFRVARDTLRRLADLTDMKAERARNNTAHAITAAQRWISDMIFGVGVLFLLLACYLWWSVSRPLLELAGQMRLLASHDTAFSIRFESWRDEIGEMARALAVFRRNTIELLESRKRLSSQAEILAGSLDKERALADEQRNFISTISHEFRTPLMAVDGQAQRLITTSARANAGEVADRAQRIRAAVFRMTSLVSSLVNAVEVAQGELRARTRPFDLSNMLEDLARYYGEIGIGRALQAQIGQLPAEIIGDPELLYQVFSNLISNAFKYSPDDGIVTLRADAKDGFVEVTVEDQGLGIPRGELCRIRERYYRASNVGSIPGTGMGLHLVDEIVRQHGGRLHIDSEEGKGTRVAVILPVEGASGVTERAGEQDLVRRGRSGDREPAVGGADRAGLHG